jgi:acetate kinase
MTAPQIERFLYNDCGLKGLSGLSNDVRVLLGSDDRRARMALDYFVHRIALMAGSLGAALEGIDGFVFTAGVGENAPAIRSAVVKRLAWLGAELDDEANLRGADVISSNESRIEVRVIATDEELMIAKHTVECLAAANMHTTEQQQ